MTIGDFAPSSRYSVSFGTGQGVTAVFYEIEEKGDKDILVHYKETYEGKGMLQSLNYKLVSRLYNNRAEKRVRCTLDAVEDYVKNLSKN